MEIRKKSAAQSPMPTALQNWGEKLKEKKTLNKMGKKKGKNQELEISQKKVKHHLECFQKKRLDDELHGKIKYGSWSFVPR